MQQTVAGQQSTAAVPGGPDAAGAMETDVTLRVVQLQRIDSQNKIDGEIPKVASPPKLPCCSELDRGKAASVAATWEGPNVGAYKGPRAKLGTFPISRWVMFILYCCYCLLAGPSFLNWTTFADMLYAADAFLWECAPGTIPIPPPETHKPKCPAQELAVNKLFNVVSCSYFFFAMLGGIALDYAGPKLGAMSGLACLVLGWMLLAFSSESFRAYIPAMIFVGAGVDMAFFPCLCGANLFPGYTATIIALYGACRSLSFVTGLALQGIFFNIPGATLRYTLLGYVGVGLGFCVCVALLIIPWRAWPPPETEKEGSAGTTQKAEEEKQEAPQPKGTSVENLGKGRSLVISSSSARPHDECVSRESCKDAGVRQETAEAESLLLTGHGEVASTGAGAGGASADTVVRLQKEEEGHGDAGITRIATANQEERVREQRRRSSKEMQVLEDEPVSRRVAVLQGMWVPLKSFMRDIASPSFLPLIPYFLFVLVDVLFFTPAANHLIPDAYSANQIITVCGFAPCIVLGYVTDRIGVLWVMLICNSAGLLSWVLLLIPGIPCLTAFQYMASILFTVQMSFLVSQIYCYVTEFFPPENLGKLIGFLCSAGGIVSLVTSPMRDYSVNNTFYPMTGLCLALAVISEGLLVFMFHWQKRTKRVRQEHAALQERIAKEKLVV